MDKSPKSRWEKIILGIIGVVFVVTVIVAVSGIGDKEKQSTNSTATTQASIEKTAQEPIILSGTGQQVTNKFKLDHPVYKVTSDNPYVLADLLDSEGKNWNNLIGEKDFWHILSYPADYVINVHNVDTSLISSWKIHLEPIKIGDNPEARRFTGTGSKTTNLFNASEGLKVIKATHSGKGTFIVILYDDSAVTYEPYMGLFGKVIGQFEGSKGVQFRRDGRYFFDVESDGDWTITIYNEGEQSAPSPTPTSQSINL